MDASFFCLSDLFTGVGTFIVETPPAVNVYISGWKPSRCIRSAGRVTALYCGWCDATFR